MTVWRSAGVVCGAASLALMAGAQQPIGTVGVQDATVAGALQVTGGRTVLVGSTTVTAKDHTAEVELNRGGAVRVCSTSGLHVSAGKAATGPMPLMLALDRGAVEIRMDATASDVVMTPDLRFTSRTGGPVDLRIRVTKNGDTCVENRGAGAPVLSIADQFGEGTYELRAGQHVLFEHGSLKEVVDHETSPCGCPPEPVMSVAEAGVSAAPGAAVAAAGSQVATTNSQVATRAVEKEHPFPAAVSQGLAPGGEVPQAPPGVAHAQVAATLTFNANGAGSDGTGAADTVASGGGKTAAVGTGVAPVVVPAPAAAVKAPEPLEVPATVVVKAQAPPPPAAPAANDVVHKVGRFFKRLFGRG